MSNETKKYRLLKDYVTPKFTFEKGTPIAYGGGRYMVGVEQYTEEELIEKSEWFEEVLPEQSKSIPNKQDERIEVLRFGDRSDISKNDWPEAYYFQFCTTHDIWLDKFPEIKNLLERYLNGEMDNPAPTPTPQGSKEWEILEFRFQSNFGEYSIKKVDDKYVADMPSNKSLTATTYPKNLLDECKIHSVRRNSDGEVFTVGDNISWGHPYDSYKTKITGFVIEKGRLKFNEEKYDGRAADFLDVVKLHKINPDPQPQEQGKEEIKLPLSQIKHLYEIWIKTLDKRPFMDFVYSRVIF